MKDFSVLRSYDCYDGSEVVFFDRQFNDILLDRIKRHINTPLLYLKLFHWIK